MAPLTVELRSALRTGDLDVALTLAAGETVALAGPSGAGKTTVLRMIAGLARPAAGRVASGDAVWLDTAAGVSLPPERREVGLVPQDYALFPHLSVEANVGFADPARAPELMARLGIAHLAKDRPGRLSGGERQRVALARALARRPAVLLLDEPLAALDAQTRRRVRDELASVLAEIGVPTLLVTHDFHDAGALADRVAVLVDGQIRQLGAVGELIDAPADPFVAAFTGANVIEDDPRGVVAFHPWAVTFGAGGIPARVVSATTVGPRTHVVTDRFVADLPADAAVPPPGTAVSGVVAPERLHVFPAA